MATIRSNTEASDAVPEIWLATALEKFRDKIILAALVQRDVRDDPAEKGDTISVNERGALSAQDKGEGSDISPEAPSNNKKSLTLNTHKYVSWSMEDVASSLAVEDALEYTEDAVDALVEAIEADLWALYSGITPQAGTAGQDITETTVLATRKTMSDNNVPGDDRVFAVSTKDTENLLGTDKLTDADKRGDEGQALRDARIGRAYGFDFMESNVVPTTGSNPTTHHNIAFHPRFATIGMRPLELPPEGSGATASYIVDEETGIALRMIQSYDHKAMGVIMSLDILYGVKVFQDTLAVHVKS